MLLSTFALSRFAQQRQENGRTSWSLDRRLSFFSTIQGMGNRFYKYQKIILLGH